MSIDPLDPTRGPSSAEHRMMLSSRLLTIADLLEHLDRAGLLNVRTELQHPDTVQTALGSAGLVSMRVSLLDRVCRLLAGDDEGMLAYFAGTGDLIPVVPNDLSELG